MKKTIFINVQGSYGGGGPTVWAARMRDFLRSNGYTVIFDKPERSDVAICIIESGKVLKKINRTKTKCIIRLDGAYYKEYWNNTPGRMWRNDMTQLHAAITRDVGLADHMVYQSGFSKMMIDSEIAKRDNNFSIINNGVDTNLFVHNPAHYVNDGFLKLGHVGMMRNGYLMESLIAVFNKVKDSGVKTKLFLLGPMDAECTSVYKKNLNQNIIHCGQTNNTSLPAKYSQFDIFLAPRMGSSCDNVITEAQSCSLACVLPSWGGNIEQIKDKDSGIVVQSGHWTYNDEYHSNMAKAVLEINKDLSGFKTRARKHAVTSLTSKIMFDKYLNLIEK